MTHYCTINTLKKIYICLLLGNYFGLNELSLFKKEQTNNIKCTRKPFICVVLFFAVSPPPKDFNGTLVILLTALGSVPLTFYSLSCPMQ